MAKNKSKIEENYIVVITNRNGHFNYVLMTNTDRDYIHDCVSKGFDFFITLPKVEYSLTTWKEKNIVDIRVLDITNMELLECVGKSDEE